MNKSKLLLLPLILISSSSFAVTEQLDFYSNGNRHSISGTLKDFNNITKYKNYLIINDAQQDAYVTLNKKKPYFITYNEQPVDLNSILERHKNENIFVNGNEYKLIDVQSNGIIIQKDANSEQYTLIKNVDNVSFDKNWLKEQEKGLKVYFNNELNNNDVLSYSQIENGLNYTNKYQIELTDNKTLDLTHYIQIDNGTNKIFKDINVSFFLSDVNVNRSPIMFKSARIQALSMNSGESDAIQPPEFQNENIDNIKVISLKAPITILPNMNKVNFEEKTFNYETITKLSASLNNFLPQIPNQLSQKFDQDSTKIDEYRKQLKASIKSEIDSQRYKFQDYIVIENKDKIFPNGSVEVYQGENRKLIVSDNIGYTENKNLEILKKNNNDLEVTDIDIDVEKIKASDKLILINNQPLQSQYYILFKTVTINNKSDNSYVFSYNGKKYVIKGKQNITIELEKAS